MQNNVLLKTDFSNLKPFKKGKVRDVYDLGKELLVVATDRISCFDVVLGCGIPGKGEVLTKISLFWFNYLKDICNNHLITADVNLYPAELKKYADVLQGRSMIVKKAKALPLECIVRGYISGSGWKEYKDKSSICGIELPNNLNESDKLLQPIFTPSTKSDSGHDMNIDKKAAQILVGEQVFQEIKDMSIALYKRAAEYAETKGIIIADTKFEFGVYNDELILIDEVLTPDSSRFWPKENYEPGRSQPSFDKQFVRDYLEGLDWDKKPPAPEVAEEIIEKTSQKYKHALEILASE